MMQRPLATHMTGQVTVTTTAATPPCSPIAEQKEPRGEHARAPNSVEQVIVDVDSRGPELRRDGARVSAGDEEAPVRKAIAPLKGQV